MNAREWCKKEKDAELLSWITTIIHLFMKIGTICLVLESKNPQLWTKTWNKLKVRAVFKSSLNKSSFSTLFEDMKRKWMTLIFLFKVMGILKVPRNEVLQLQNQTIVKVDWKTPMISHLLQKIQQTVFLKASYQNWNDFLLLILKGWW